MSFSEITSIGPPHPDQIEICIFGPNYGECIVRHLVGNWVVLDSCLYTPTTEPVALAYLRALGIDTRDASACSLAQRSKYLLPAQSSRNQIFAQRSVRVSASETSS